MTDDKPPRPDALEFTPSAVPDELRDRDQWVAWRYTFTPDRDEWTKIPVDAAAGGNARSNDPDTWKAFSRAVAYHDRDDTNTDGVGFVVHDEDLFVGLDLDDCRDPDTGEIEAWAEDLLEDVPTYAEVSPSGTGLRLFGFGFVPDGGTRSDVDGADGHLEMYETGRYLTVTGHAIDDAPDEARQVNDEIADVHAEYIADDAPFHRVAPITLEELTPREKSRADRQYRRIGQNGRRGPCGWGRRPHLPCRLGGDRWYPGALVFNPPRTEL